MGYAKILDHRQERGISLIFGTIFILLFPCPRFPNPGVRAVLKNSFLFRGWPEEELARLGAASHLRAAARGDVLFERGDPCVSLAMLLEGQVQMFRLGDDGLETVLHAIHAPGLVGCAALFLGRAFPASSRVVSASAEFLQIEGTTLIVRRSGARNSPFA